MYLPGYTRLMLELHKQEPIKGDFLAIGRQTVAFTHEEAAKFLWEEGIEPRDVSSFVDFKTIAGKHHNNTNTAQWITDETFLSMFCDVRARSLDVSAYERAEIIHDMSVPVPRKLHAIADFIFEGSCIDNIFNPAQAMLNIDMMLRGNGRLFMVNAGTITPKDTYVALGEEWYQLFLQQNGYKEISVVSYSYDKVDDWEWHKGRQTRPTGPGQPIDAKHCCVVVSARKPAMRMHRMVQPVQQGYVDMHHPVKRKFRSLAGRAIRKVRRKIWPTSV